MFLNTEIQAEKNRLVGFQPIWTTMLIKLDHPPQVVGIWFFFDVWNHHEFHGTTY